MTTPTNPWGFPVVDAEVDKPTGSVYMQQTTDLVKSYKPGRSVDLLSQLSTIATPVEGDRVWVAEKKEWYVYRSVRLHYGTAGWEPWAQITKVFGGTHEGAALGDPTNGAQIICGTVVGNWASGTTNARATFANGGFTTRVFSIILSNGQANQSDFYPALYRFTPSDLTGFYYNTHRISSGGAWQGATPAHGNFRLQYVALGV